ncbi:hypothetical protein CLCR_11266 [Cladophialophora carrionii]|uniref:Alkyl hydroperoxide reductase subunit C/ Thiol specific antioxidant domain-containing protein n=1 Tax=Cladophialophora carrionii TaxID=86049 RepID=A0A1C1CFF7_9EURO|nr:hypothetical protein CLCR_11266 [Cladophialophora carrionii]
MDFHKFIDNSWAILFSHPADFTPVCKDEFEKRGVKMIGLSANDLQSPGEWIQDINEISKTQPAISDYRGR